MAPEGTVTFTVAVMNQGMVPRTGSPVRDLAGLAGLVLLVGGLVTFAGGRRRRLLLG